jgi:hypothetical protein
MTIAPELRLTKIAPKNFERIFLKVPLRANLIKYCPKKKMAWCHAAELRLF